LHEPFEDKNEKEKKRLVRLKRELFLKETDKGVKDFRGIKLGEIQVKNKTLENVDFSEAVFESTRFENCMFKGKINFSNCRFKSDLRFNNTTFEDLTFKGVKFEGFVEFRNCTFKGRVEFKVLKSKSTTEFNDILFLFCIFLNDLVFSGVNFKSDTRFILCDFVKRVLFLGYSAPDQKSIKYIPTRFNSSRKIEIEFYFCTFRDVLEFRPEIGENAELNFSHSKFEKPERVEFRNVNLSKASFLHVQGLERIRFTNATWNRIGLIKRFCLYDEIRLREGKIGEILRNIREQLDESNRLKQEREIMEAIAQTYRQLRIAYESSLMYPEAGDFYVGEMEMKRLNAVFRKKPIKNRLGRWLIQNLSLTAFYRYLSYYGECYWLPLLWIFLFVLGFSIGYSYYYGLDLNSALSTSFLTFFQMPPTETKISSWIMGCERLTGLILTAIFILALRRKFKKTSE